jgi:hypothetical protein
MSFFSRLKYWQKGFVAGFLFCLFLGLIYTGVLIVFEVLFENKGIPHTCYLVTRSFACTFGEAIMSRFGFLVIFLLAIGLPVAGIGALLGYLIDKVRIHE